MLDAAVLPAVLRTLYLAAFPGQAVLRAAVAAAVRSGPEYGTPRAIF